MSLITRGNGLGQVARVFTVDIFIYSISGNVKIIPEPAGVSMSNFYMGIITLLLLPMILEKKQKNKKLYGSLAVISFFICMGNTSFVHMLLYRFVPMYASFRFPTTNRVFLMIFVMLTLVPVLSDILKTGKISLKVLKVTLILTSVTLLAGSISGVIVNAVKSSSEIDLTKLQGFAESAIRVSIILSVYFFVFYTIYKKQVYRLWRKGFIVGIVIVEVFTWSFLETPLTIAKYAQGNILQTRKFEMTLTSNLAIIIREN